jgi:hypothetical protein
MSDAAIGLRAHSGWAALVAVAGPTAAPIVVLRRRVDLVSPGTGLRQPFHVAEGLDLAKAERLVRRSTDTARDLARHALRGTIEELKPAGHEVAACGLVTSSGRSLPDLARILASHALIHAAEGELFREAIVHAARASGLPVHAVREKDLMERASVSLGVPAEEVTQRLEGMGRALGPPWRQDEKRATLVAWLSLAQL